MSYSSAYFLGVFSSFLNGLIWKDPDAGKDWRQEEKGTTVDEMVGWHHRGHEFEWTPGVGDRQGGLACCSPWGRSQTRLSDWTELNWSTVVLIPGGSVVKNLPASAGAAGAVGLVLGSGRPPGGGNGNPLQYSSRDNPVDRGAWWATIHGVTKSWTWLTEHACLHNLQY